MLNLKKIILLTSIMFICLLTISNISADTNETFNEDINIENTVELSTNENENEKLDATIEILNTTVGQGELYKAKITHNNTPVTDTIVIFFLGDDMTPYAVRTNDEGIAQIRMNIVPGTYQIITAIQENDIYKLQYLHNTVTVVEGMKTSFVDIIIPETFSDENGTVNITIGEGNATGSVLFKIDDVDYKTVLLNNGFISLILPILPEGYHYITLFYSGDEKYLPTEALGTLLVNPPRTHLIEAKNITIFYRNGTKFTAKLTDKMGNPISGVNLTFTLKNTPYNRLTDKNGVASLTVNLDPGDYEIYTSYLNNTAKNIITVLPTIEGQNLEMYHLNGNKYEVKVIDGQGNPLKNASVLMNINGIFYNKFTDKEGIARLTINLNPGTYIITSWNPNDGAALSNNIRVNYLLTGENIELSFEDGTQYQVTLKKVVNNEAVPNPGQLIKMNINGVFYEKVTDSYGIARLTINLNPGHYIITSFYGEFAYSNNITVRPA